MIPAPSDYVRSLPGVSILQQHGNETEFLAAGSFLISLMKSRLALLLLLVDLRRIRASFYFRDSGDHIASSGDGFGPYPCCPGAGRRAGCRGTPDLFSLRTHSSPTWCARGWDDPLVR
jgi:hypothetical protein